MKKKLLSLALAIVLVLSLAACGGKGAEEDSKAPAEVTDTADPAAEQTPEETPEEAPEPEPEEEPEEEPEVSAPEINVYTLRESTVFSNGMACILFRDDASGESCAGIIDTKGKLQHYFSGNVVSRDQNKNGYMYSQKDKTFYVVNPKGDVTTHEFGEDEYLATYGDGYVVIREKKSGFEAVEFVYHIYDETGKEVTTYSSGDSEAANLLYAGEGTFIFVRTYNRISDEQRAAANSYSYSMTCADIYFAKSNVWRNGAILASSTDVIPSYTYQDGIFMIRGARQNGSSNTHPGEFTYVDNQGNVKTLTVPADYGTEPRYLAHRGGVMLFWDSYTKQIYTYDMKANSWVGYQGKYTDKINSSYVPVLGDGYVGIPLKGADNRTYTTIVDSSMKDVLDSPVLGRPRALRNGVLYTEESGLRCYDMKGTELSVFSNVNISANWYDEGIICNSNLEYLKPDGTTAFEVSFSGAKHVILAP